jgi:sugar O-acyltransferase (sialic acid O-acetyltransferase NeuD family)
MAFYQILGQSNYAVAILLDTLWHLHIEPITAEIVSNIPPEDNESLNHAYHVEGIETTEISHDAWQRDHDARLLIGSIGRSRVRIVEFFRREFSIEPHDYDSTVDPRASIPRQLTIGHGVHVSPGVTIAPHAELRDFVVVNRNTSVGHHTVLEEFVTLNPGVNVAGVCTIERGVTVGVGASVIDGITIGANTLIGAGSVVTRDIPPNVVAYGVPAQVIRER